MMVNRSGRRRVSVAVAILVAAGASVAGPTSAPASIASTIWSSLITGVGVNLSGIACDEAATCYAVGASGTVIVTRDAGMSWSVESTGITGNLGNVSCPTVSTCFAVGAFARTLLVTTDSGATWRDLGAAFSQDLANISCPNTSTCWAVGVGGAIFDTKDGGATWRSEGVRTRDILSGISCPSTSTCFAAGELTLEKTTDGGNSWYAIDPSVPHSFLAISCPNANRCIAVGPPRGAASTTLLTTFDGGASWSSHDTGSAVVLNSVTCADVVHCFVTDRDGLVLVTSDGGASWLTQRLGTSNTLSGIGCLSSTVCFVVGAYATLMASPDGPRTVTNANDAGPGSVRDAIVYANGHNGLDTITFGIDSGPQSIALQSGLPPITNPAIVDATTQPGYAGAPIIELNGSAAGVATGLLVSAGSSTLRGFVINRFHGDGIFLGLGSGNVVQGSYIGTDMAGASASPNEGNGVVVLGPSTDNLIGGTGPGARNVISASGDKGIVIAQGGSATVVGNFIGTDAFGAIGLPNHFWGVGIESSNGSRISGNVISGNGVSGVKIEGGSQGNVFDHNKIGTNTGGTAALANGTWGVLINGASNNTIGPGNVISGNGQDGVVINDQQSSGNVVAGNLIGTDATGTQAIGNGRIGVYLPFATHNTIGGTTPAARNVISGNPSDGINIGGEANTVQGNYIGTDITGMHALGNETGVFLYQGANNLVGGPTAGERNLIAANRFSGVNIGGGSATGNVVQGNYIGTDVTGGQPLGNQQGVTVFMGLNTIAGNVISANQYEGVLIVSCGGNVVKGNIIGSDRTGTVAIGNGDSGVNLQNAFNNLIGGAGPEARNVISGNTYPGIEISGSEATGNVVAGNFIGTDGSGTAALPNGGFGVSIDGAAANRIGDPGAGNVISGNGMSGIGINGGSSGNRVRGNFIGTNFTGSAAVPNQAFGIGIDGSPSTTVADNLISGNVLDGIYVVGVAANHSTIQGNLIGTDLSGTRALGNGSSGVTVENSTDNLIGGTSTSTRNVISGNGVNGVFVFGRDSTRNRIQGNYVGVNQPGAAALANGYTGVQIGNGSTGNFVGGTAAGAGNVVSGNANNGVEVNFATNNAVQGNLIGTSSSGSTAIGNGATGVSIFASTGTQIGGPSPTARNVISGNGTGGIVIFDAQSAGNSIQGNLIGTDASGSQPLANLGNGINLDSSGPNHTLITHNIIAFNSFNGIIVWAGIANAIRANSIYSNGAMGIDLNNDGVTLNDRKDVDGGANNSQNFPVLSHVVRTPARLVIVGSIDTPNPQTVTIEIYASASPNPGADYTGYGEGQTLIGTTKPNPAGQFTLVLPTVPKGTVISATATDAQGNTSEFALDRIA